MRTMNTTHTTNTTTNTSPAVSPAEAMVLIATRNAAFERVAMLKALLDHATAELSAADNAAWSACPEGHTIQRSKLDREWTLNVNEG